MGTRIRLARAGAKKRPFYRIVVADIRAPRDGKFIEKLGTYNPLLSKEDPNRVSLNAERVTHWLGQGATPSERVEAFLVNAKLFERSKKRKKVLDDRNERSRAAAEQKAKEEAEKRAKEEAEKKAEEEAAKAAEAEAAKAAAEEAKDEPKAE